MRGGTKNVSHADAIRATSLAGVVIALLLLAAAALAAEQRRPRLEVVGLSGAPQRVPANGSFTVGTAVKNRGRASSKPATVRFRLTRPGGRTPIGSRSVPPLTPNGVSKRATALRALVPPGAYRLRVCVSGRCRTAKRETLVTRRPSTTPPAPVTLTSPPDGALLNSRKPSIAGTADPSAPVTVTITSGTTDVASASAKPDSEGRWTALPPEPLADGSYSVRAVQGDRTSAARSFTIDATAPSVTIEHPADGATTDLMAFDGQAGDGGPLAVRLSNGSELSPDRTESGWSVLAPPLAPGTYTLTAEQSDAAGNLGRATATFTVPFTVLAAGDIAACDSNGDEATAALLAQHAGTVVTLGDNAYDSAPGVKPYDCYEPSWGPFKPRTMPVPGNHEYEDSPGAADYFAYFGAAANGATGAGYYSYDVGSWHVIALNTSDNCSPVACTAVSEQVTWLRADLAAHAAAKCTLAYFHHPRFSSYLGANATIQPLWQALNDGGADLVLNGHAHNYERFAPLDAQGAADPDGLTEIVAGTGGRSHHPFSAAVDQRAVVRNDDTFGILAVRLEPDGWSWRFLPSAGATFTDSGGAQCH